MSSKRRLAVLAVATSLAATTGTAQAAPAQPSAQWATVARTAAAKPPASASGLARDLGVDTSFAWRTLDELAQHPGRDSARVQSRNRR
jgi:hypothetical protein